MVMIYGIRSCDACRAARKWLKQHAIEHEYRDIRDDGLDEALLQHWALAAGWETMINQRSITWRKIPAVDRSNLNHDRAIQLIMTFPTVMKRPVLDLGEEVIVGFNEERYQNSFS